MFVSKQVSHAATITPTPAPIAQPPASRSEVSARERPPAVAIAPPKPAAAQGDVTTTVPAASPAAVAAAAPAAGPAADDSAPDESPGQVTDDKEVSLALGRWQKAMLTNDAAEIVPSYAPHINRFFLKTQVSRAFVRDYMERDEETGTRLTRYDMEDISMKHLKADEIQVAFRANFAVSTPDKDRTGEARTTLILKRLEGDWKIVYERDLKD